MACLAYMLSVILRPILLLAIQLYGNSTPVRSPDTRSAHRLA
ncbi:hypothetical protein QWZ13_18350 [Reinekea marina]|nr:hypothetical protein [Reinekea marina]MDN3650873.1 hypothetical protein [Reinekea marina]